MHLKSDNTNKMFRNTSSDQHKGARNTKQHVTETKQF